jgi:NADPH:quinone reductase-like Zn-dependent oxidoreductase
VLQQPAGAAGHAGRARGHPSRRDRAHARGDRLRDRGRGGLAAQTALQALRDVARVRAGERVLLHGASGGVGLFAIQIARALGAHVTTSSGAEARARCASLGAHEALDYAADAPFDPPRRFRVVLDIYGKGSLARARCSRRTRCT